MTKRPRLGSCVAMLCAMTGCSKPVASGPSRPPPSADPAMPRLRVGAESLRDGGALEARAISHEVDKDLEIVRLDLTAQECHNGANDRSGLITIDIGPGRGRGHGWLRRQMEANHDDVLVARPADQVGRPIAGDAVFASDC